MNGRYRWAVILGSGIAAVAAAAIFARHGAAQFQAPPPPPAITASDTRAIMTKLDQILANQRSISAQLNRMGSQVDRVWENTRGRR
ncbi:MAG: hypothetical protein PHN82_04430 [bacterium]|nr:hypothetical protein [bacterium]